MTDWIVIASGPSLTPDDVDKCRQYQEDGKVKVITVNNSYRMAPWADVAFAADRRWWDAHHDAVAKAGIRQRVTVSAAAARLYNLTYYKLAGEGEHRPKKKELSDGRNSGHMAISLAYHLKATRIILLGFDFQHTGGKAHWFGDHPEGWGNAGNLPEWKKRLPLLITGLEKTGVEVINCSRETAIDCVRRVPLGEIICNPVSK